MIPTYIWGQYCVHLSSSGLGAKALCLFWCGKCLRNSVLVSLRTLYAASNFGFKSFSLERVRNHFRCQNPFRDHDGYHLLRQNSSNVNAEGMCSIEAMELERQHVQFATEDTIRIGQNDLVWKTCDLHPRRSPSSNFVGNGDIGNNACLIYAFSISRAYRPDYFPPKEAWQVQHA